MKTLVIHPEDSSTDFLKPIYKNLCKETTTIVTGGMSAEDVLQSVKDHERVIMMGHGSPRGLFGINFNNSFVIDKNHVEALSYKKQNVYIWCNADQFVNNYQLSGFYSGMFISEIYEAEYCGLKNIVQEDVDVSNNFFAEELGKLINKDVVDIYYSITKFYKKLAITNSVANYNCRRLGIA
jgi:hypothetical protein